MGAQGIAEEEEGTEKLGIPSFQGLNRDFELI